jgi:hypothetical protein
MLRLALASVATALLAFATVAFWPSHGPSREVSMAVILPASTEQSIGEIGDVVRGAESPAEALTGERQTGEVELASLDARAANFEPPGTADDGSGFDIGGYTDGEDTGGTAPDEAATDDGATTASFDEIDQALMGNSSDSTGLPRLPVRKPLPPLTSYTLVERIAEIGPGAIARIEEKFSDAGVAWPPERLAFLAFKDEKVIEVQAQSASGEWEPVVRYPVLKASGDSGPKLLEGDKQVPEGVYRIESLNPNSRYHVSLRVGYPNEFDRAMAKADGRKKLGGDIMIHGKALSIGCLAVGDPAAEEFFVMAHAVGLHAVDVIIAPRDFRKTAIFAAVKETINLSGPVWLPRLYDDIKAALEPFPEMPSTVTPNIAQR